MNAAIYVYIQYMSIKLAMQCRYTNQELSAAQCFKDLIGLNCKPKK